jgi:hypothetical protein
VLSRHKRLTAATQPVAGDIELVGEADWAIWCRRGRSLVRGSTSE